jgi:hypothetical protein
VIVSRPGDHAQQGRLAAAGGADDDDELAILDLVMSTPWITGAVPKLLTSAHPAKNPLHAYCCLEPFAFSVSTRPLTNQRCIAMTTSTGGSIASMAVAMTRFHSVWRVAAADHRLMPMTMVYIESSVVISSGQRYWFQP